MMKFKSQAVLSVLSALVFLTLFSAACFATQDQPRPQVFFPETNYQFSAVLDGTKVVHDFVIQNKGSATLKVERVKTGCMT